MYASSIPTGGTAVHQVVRPVTTQAMAAAARATSIVSMRRRACRTRARPLPGAGGSAGLYRLARAAPGRRPGPSGAAKPGRASAPGRAWESDHAWDSDHAEESDHAW